MSWLREWSCVTGIGVRKGVRVGCELVLVLKIVPGESGIGERYWD